MLNRLQRMKNKKGFTLVELIVVIAIIAILTAVIVPLVGRYSAQATYSTLQSAAKTISDNANTAAQDAVLSGAVLTLVEVVGTKSGGSLELSAGGKTATATLTTSALEHDAGGDLNSIDVDTRMLVLLADSLVNTLPNGCSFYVTMNKNAVLGVVYSPDNNVILTGDDTGEKYSTADFQKVVGFEEAYEWSSNAIAVGLSGKFIPAST